MGRPWGWDHRRGQVQPENMRCLSFLWLGLHPEISGNLFTKQPRWMVSTSSITQTLQFSGQYNIGRFTMGIQHVKPIALVLQANHALSWVQHTFLLSTSFHAPSPQFWVPWCGSYSLSRLLSLQPVRPLERWCCGQQYYMCTQINVLNTQLQNKWDSKEKRQPNFYFAIYCTIRSKPDFLVKFLEC